MTTTTRRPSGTDIRTAAVAALSLGMAAAAAAIGFTLTNQAPAHAPFTLSLIAIIAITAAAEATAVHRPTGGHNHTLSISEIALIIGLAFTAPQTLIIGRVTAGLIVYGAIRRIPAPKIAFNIALTALEATAAAATYHLILGTATPAEPQGWIAAAAAVTAATAIGLGAVRAILHIHGQPRPLNTTLFSLTITTAATLIGILAVTTLTTHPAAAIPTTALVAITYLAMRTTNQAIPPAA